MDLIALFQSGGMILVFVAFNVWLIQEVMGRLKQKDETIITLVEKFDKTINVTLDAIKIELTKHTEMLSKICYRIEIELNVKKKDNDN